MSKLYHRRKSECSSRIQSEEFTKDKHDSAKWEKPDAITYYPASKKLFAFNGDTNNASVIDINSLKEITTIDLGGAPEFAVPDDEGLLYNNFRNYIIQKCRSLLYVTISWLPYNWPCFATAFLIILYQKLTEVSCVSLTRSSL